MIKAEAENSPRQLVKVLGSIGLAPIILFAILLVLTGNQSGFSAPLTDAIKTYSAVVISFLGGIHWGIALGGTSSAISNRSLMIVLVPPFFGWIAVFLNEPMSLALLIVCFSAQGAWDNFAAHRGEIPGWFSRLRLPLTIITVASLALAMFVNA